MYQNKYIPILISKSLIKSNDRFFLNDNIDSSIGYNLVLMCNM